MAIAVCSQWRILRPVFIASWLAACAAAPGDPTRGQPGPAGVSVDPALQGRVAQALQDATRRTGIDASRLRLVLAETVLWPDGALGCPQSGMAYTQALVDGYRIHIAAGETLLHYHGSLRGQPRFCPAELVQAPSPLGPRR
jgi:hypothetical protein